MVDEANNTHTLTALNGMLVRRSGGWYWADGASAPNVHDMTLRAVAPNFRCTTTSGKTFVEIPHDWDASRYWLNGQIDEEARQRITSMLSDGSAEASLVYAEGLAELVDDHRLSKHGYRLPIQLWDAVMGKVCGAVWDKADESAIFERARVLGWWG